MKSGLCTCHIKGLLHETFLLNEGRGRLVISLCLESDIEIA